MGMKIYFKDLKTGVVYSYSSIEEAKENHKGFTSLIKMTDSELQALETAQEAQAKSHEAKANIDAQIKKHTEEMNIALLTDDTETAKFHAQKIKELRK